MIQVSQVELAHKMKMSVQRGIENSTQKSQIHSVVFIIRTVVYKIHTVVFIIHTVDLRFLRTVFDFSLHRQSIFRALSVYIIAYCFFLIGRQFCMCNWVSSHVTLSVMKHRRTISERCARGWGLSNMKFPRL